MNKIVDFDFIDVIPVSRGIIFARNHVMPDGSSRTVFQHYDIYDESLTAVTKGSYLLSKFGASFKEITPQLNDVVNCDTAKFPGGGIAILYPTGEMGYFTSDGTLKSMGDIYYGTTPARSPSYLNGYLWCCVPQSRAIIRYSTEQNRISMRIGGEENSSFGCPVSTYADEKGLYICDYANCNIRLVDMETLTVSDYLRFDEPVLKYFRVRDREYVILRSGIYLI